MKDFSITIVSNITITAIVWAISKFLFHQEPRVMEVALVYLLLVNTNTGKKNNENYLI